MGARDDSWWFFYAGFRGVGRGLVRRRLRLVPILVAIDPAPVVSMYRVLRPGFVLICKHWRGRAADVGMRWWSRVKRQGGWKALSQESHQQPSRHEATACPRCYIAGCTTYRNVRTVCVLPLHGPLAFHRSIPSPRQPRRRCVRLCQAVAGSKACLEARGPTTRALLLAEAIARRVSRRKRIWCSLLEADRHRITIASRPCSCCFGFRKASQKGSSLITGDIEMLPRPASDPDLLPDFPGLCNYVTTLWHGGLAVSCIRATALGLQK